MISTNLTNNFVNANCAVTSFPQRGEDQQKICWNGKKPATMKGCNPIQPSACVGHVSTSPQMWKDIKRKRFPIHCASNCASPPRKIYPSSMSTMKILAKVDKHPFCELWNNFIVPFVVLQLSGDNRNFHPSCMGIDQCHPVRYWKASHSQPFWKGKTSQEIIWIIWTIIASLKTQQPANHPFQNPWYGTFSSRSRQATFFFLCQVTPNVARISTRGLGKKGEWTPQPHDVSWRHKNPGCFKFQHFVGKNYSFNQKPTLPK